MESSAEDFCATTVYSWLLFGAVVADMSADVVVAHKIHHGSYTYDSDLPM